MSRRETLAVRALGSQTGSITGDLVLETGRFMLFRPIRSALFITGLLIFAFAKGLTPPADRLAAYEAKLPTGREVDEIVRLEDKVARALLVYKESQGWFWSCSGPCVSNKARYDALSNQHSVLVENWKMRVSEAKAELGPLSVQAVSETRAYFWSHISDGWRIATDVRVTERGARKQRAHISPPRYSSQSGTSSSQCFQAEMKASWRP